MSKVKLAIVIAVAIHVLSFALMLRKVSPVYENFYSFAWWSYIAVIAGVNHLRARNSLIFDHPREALWVFLLSTPVWLFFEIYNFRLDNWNYLGVPSNVYVRWPGYFIAFGTVLPGIFETVTLVGNLGLGRVSGKRMKISSALLVRFVAVGAVMMAGAALRPEWFFPFVWLGLIFLLDPLLYWSEARDESLLAQAEKGDYSILVRLLVAGMFCGLIWEFWNFWAGAKWVYSVPKLGFLKIFEMPLLGFFGFPPFAIECYLIYRLFDLIRRRYLTRQLAAQALVVVLLAAYCIVVFRYIDRYNVLLWRM